MDGGDERGLFVWRMGISGGGVLGKVDATVVVIFWALGCGKWLVYIGWRVVTVFPNTYSFLGVAIFLVFCYIRLNL